MKLLTVLFPAYAVPNYAGATPRPYEQRGMQKLESALVKMGEVFRERQGLEHVHVGPGGHLEHSLVARYTLFVKDDKVSAADIVVAITEHLPVKVEDIRILGDE